MLHVYVLEAHAVGEFDTPPLPPPVQIKEEIKVHSSEEERAHAAGLAKALLEAKAVPSLAHRAAHPAPSLSAPRHARDARE